MKAQARQELLHTLEARFQNNMHRHKGLAWREVLARLGDEARALASLLAMETSGGEPDVIGRNATTGQFVFCDCSPESPAGRRSLCYDRGALDSRKENRPQGSAVESAAEMGVELDVGGVDEAQGAGLREGEAKLTGGPGASGILTAAPSWVAPQP